MFQCRRWYKAGAFTLTENAVVDGAEKVNDKVKSRRRQKLLILVLTMSDIGH